jgi:hypothetical protein
MTFKYIRRALGAMRSPDNNDKMKWEALTYIIEKYLESQGVDIDYEDE